MSHLPRCDLAWNISSSSHFDDRLLHFFWFMRIPRSSLPSYVTAGGNLTTRRFYPHFSDSFQPALANILSPACITSQLFHVTFFSRHSTVTSTSVRAWAPDAAEWMSVSTHEYVAAAFCINYNSFLCQHMPPILKLNEQVIQMTYKVKREQRDCQRLVCI